MNFDQHLVPLSANQLSSATLYRDIFYSHKTLFCNEKHTHCVIFYGI